MLESHLIFWKPITLYFRWWWLRVHFLLPEPLQPWLLWACASPPSSMMSFHSCFYSFKPSSWPDPKGLNPKFGGKVSNTIGRVILNPFLERRCSNGPQTWYYAHHELSQHSGHTYFRMPSLGLHSLLPSYHLPNKSNTHTSFCVWGHPELNTHLDHLQSQQPEKP